MTARPPRTRGRASAALVAITAALLAAAAITGYVRSELADDRALAARATSALDDEEVRRLLATRMVNGLAGVATSDLLAARPLLISAITAVVDTPPFRRLLHPRRRAPPSRPGERRVGLRAHAAARSAAACRVAAQRVPGGRPRPAARPRAARGCARPARLRAPHRAPAAGRGRLVVAAPGGGAAVGGRLCGAGGRCAASPGAVGQCAGRGRPGRGRAGGGARNVRGLARLARRRPRRRGRAAGRWGRSGPRCSATCARRRCSPRWEGRWSWRWLGAHRLDERAGGGLGIAAALCRVVLGRCRSGGPLRLPDRAGLGARLPAVPGLAQPPGDRRCGPRAVRRGGALRPGAEQPGRGRSASRSPRGCSRAR